MNTDRIEKKILLRAPLERVWRALSNSTEFGTWFGMKIEGQFAPGAVMRGVIVPSKANAEVAAAQKPFEGTPFQFVVEEVQPRRLFSFRWHPGAIDPNIDYSKEPMTLVSFLLQEVPEGVMLTLTKSGFDRIPLERRAKAFAGNERGWEMQMKSIELYVTEARTAEAE